MGSNLSLYSKSNIVLPLCGQDLIGSQPLKLLCYTNEIPQSWTPANFMPKETTLLAK